MMVKVDCNEKYDISKESIYFRVGNRWLRHRLDLIKLEDHCYLNFAQSDYVSTVKVGTSFLSDYFAYFDDKYGSVDMISIDD
eukprot:CAMPEP_0168623918 /NCGR_PEP_ID=MMETSP0449_2-20121227/9103_1 /TAXON_ID=1082188 /ORGANISM="Strombidium rassoulzadegani, Strain ras09" /LENGTH=81 /DNA_ID=CAMNT_0008665375 /DNA_START=345 /DNA_END=590 /DNA_ORIENTATION=-